MYVVLNRFLLSHQSLDFRRVPEFFKLFYGFDLEVLQENMVFAFCSEGLWFVPELINHCLNNPFLCQQYLTFVV